ncbi:TonB-dependent receptor [Sediminibacterium ginsengisoli]|uniref:TonB-dependent Receptor Plug Domain n=1 Tax=Sediminibacterium ginsengisoli TaxID=413434 RepID=A0A1T4KBY3_9BACT|nr:TonB-dependent receptor [Sediminibacterium ginsengisoli]SJZ39929.1 TonB-dependent Receptor Plug Domain [Sediminibacterium ginsengisoli]
MIKALHTITFLFLTIPFWAEAQSVKEIRGKVTDTANAPLSFCNIKISQSDLVVSTAIDGSFTIPVLPGTREIQLEVSHVGKQVVQRTISAAAFGNFLVIRLQDLSLSLNKVEVTGIRKGNASNSSILYNREAIAQLQAFSLADILNNLPGKTTTAPQLQNPQTITLRSDAGGNHALSNSLGTAIILDGVRQSNDANMQSRSLSIRGMTSSILGSRSDGSFDVPFGGIDLREIPADNIESVEVVSGVASAQYNELTDGAIIINRQAGRTRYQFNTRINEGSTDFSLSKGFGLGKKLGALNLSLGYLNSNKDPRDKIKSYNRVNSSLMWTIYLSKKIKNTLSFDYNTRLDDVKVDPDDDAELKTYAKSRSLSISNRTSITFGRGFVKSMNMSLSFSSGYQDTYNQWLLNGPPKGLANKDTTGVYEGIFLPGAYLAEERIIGKPRNYAANISMISVFNTDLMLHSISYGLNISGSGNKGEGIVVDPERPRWINISNQNERPYNYKELNDMTSAGVYLQDNITLRLGRRNVHLGMGLRYDIQNGTGSLQPRMSARYMLSKKLELNAAYGISSKSPTMAHRNPAPAWLDIPLLNLYNGYADQSLFLVYTQKIIPDNSNLKPSRSSQLEVGLKYNDTWGSTSFFAYLKQDRNGFNSYSRFQPLNLPEYGYTAIPGQKITYYPTGNTITYAGAGNYVITNGLSSNNYGVEWMIQTRKIPVLQTSFTAGTSFSLSTYHNATDRRVIMVDNAYIQQGKEAWYGVYHADEKKNWSLTTKFGTDTHIPKLGFVISLSADIFWQKSTETLNHGNEPIGYIDKNLQYHDIPYFSSSNPVYGYLKLDPDVVIVNGVAMSNTAPTKLPFVYGNLNMRIAKEINKQIRLSLSAYNVLNLRPEYYNPVTQSTTVYGSPVSLTAGLSVQF